MPYLLLQDIENQVCQHMFVSPDMDDLITSNVLEMKDAGMNVHLNTTDPTIPKTKLTKAGWFFDDGLYDKLVIRYNQGGLTPLKGWR